MKERLITVVGPTATGKSDLGVHLAKKYNGEIISADSRQIYTELNIGSGKITGEEMEGIPHHGLDIVNLGRNFSVSEYKNYTDKKIKEIHDRGKLPLLVGGTGFYIQSIVDDYVSPEVPENPILRKKLSQKSLSELQNILEEKDPERYKTIEQKNPRRLVRAIEIATELGYVPHITPNERFNTLQIGLYADREYLTQKIQTRTKKRLQSGMIEEIKYLLTKYDRDFLYSLGFDQSLCIDYIEGTIQDKEELENLIALRSVQYAKRQMTWFKKDKRIHWIDIEKDNIQGKAEKLIENFLK